MRMDFKSLYCFTSIFFVFLIKKAVSLKKEWSYLGVHFIDSEDINNHASLYRRQGDLSSNEVHRDLIPEKLNNVVTDKVSTPSREPNDDSNGALPLPSNNIIKAENESTKAKDEIEEFSATEKSAFKDNRILTDDPDSGLTTAPDVKSETGYKKFNEEKISYKTGNLATSWPLGIIPYYFDMKSYDHILVSRVRDVMDSLESASCVVFKPLIVKPEEKQNWIHITNPKLQRECMHRGMHQGTGEIRMVLGLDCLKRRDILHTLLHAMGFMDEVSHPHRDQFIRIMWNNIQPKYQNLFSIASSSTMPVEYDPMSIMHFHDRAFTKNGHATIVPLMPGLQIQPSDKLSQLDKMKLRLAFGHECNRRTVDNLLDTCKAVLHEEQKNGIAPKMEVNVELRHTSPSDYENDPETNSSNEKKAEDKTDLSNKKSKENRTTMNPKPDSSNESPKDAKTSKDTELESFERTMKLSATTQTDKKRSRGWSPTRRTYHDRLTTSPFNTKATKKFTYDWEQSSRAITYLNTKTIPTARQPR